MGKSKGNTSVPNRHIYSRASYLHQAAVLLNYQGLTHSASANASQLPKTHKSQPCAAAAQKISHCLVKDMRAVCLKAQIRQSPATKRTVCKYCDTLLIEGQNCHTVVENASKEQAKPWVDVLVIQCETCGNKKRYPISLPKQQRKAQRKKVVERQRKDQVDESNDI